MKPKRGVTLLFLVVLVIVSSLILNLAYYFNTSTERIVVTKTMVKTSGTKERVSSKYLIFSKTIKGKPIVFENTDLFLYFKFNSSDLQASLEEKKTYEVQLVGFRIPFLSMYKNVVGVKKL